MSKDEPLRSSNLQPLAANELRWQCDVDSLPFETTDELSSDSKVVGQPTAREALEFGLLCLAPRSKRVRPWPPRDGTKKAGA